MLADIRVKREDRKRAMALLELAGIKVYRTKGGVPVITDNRSIKFDIKFPADTEAKG